MLICPIKDKYLINIFKNVLYKLGASYLQIIQFLKGYSPPKHYHDLLNIMSFQTCMNVFFCGTYDIFVYTGEIKGNQKGLVTFYKIVFCVQQKKVIWNDMMMRKRCQNNTQ